MDYLLWGLFIQHSDTLKVKRRKIVSPEGSLHKLCVSISVLLLQLLGRTWQEPQVLVNVFWKVLIKKLVFHYTFSCPVLSHQLLLQLSSPLSVCNAHGLSLCPVTCNDDIGTAQLWCSILNELLKHLVHHSVPHRFLQKTSTHRRVSTLCWAVVTPYCPFPRMSVLI